MVNKYFDSALAELEKEGLLEIFENRKWKLTEKGKLEREKIMILFSSIKS